MNFTIFVLGAFIFIIGSLIAIINLVGEMKYQGAFSMKGLPYPQDRNPALIGKLVGAGSILMIAGLVLIGIGAFVRK